MNYFHMKNKFVKPLQIVVCFAGLLSLSSPAFGQALTQTFTNSSSAYDISHITIPNGTGMIGDLNIGFNVGFGNHPHGWPVDLISPTGTRVTLVSPEHFGPGYNDGGAFAFDDESTNPPPSGFMMSILPNTYQPIDLLSLLDGEVADGLWTLQGMEIDIESWSIIFTPAADDTGGELLANVPGFGLLTVQPFLNTTTTHLRTQALRGPSGTPLASNDSVMRREVSLWGGEQLSRSADGWEAWFQGYGEDGDVGSGATGYNYGLYGGAFGADRWLSKDTLMGVFGGVSSASMDLDAGGASMDVEAARIGLQGVKRWEKFYLLGSLHYGQNTYEGDRVTFTGTARSDFDANELGAYVEAGVPYKISSPGYLLDGVTIQPLAAFQYISVSQDGYTETGAGASNLVVGEQDAYSERLSVGLLLAKDFKTSLGMLSPYVEGRYTHEFNEGSEVLNANFSGGGSVISQGSSPGEDFMELRAGTSLDLSERTTLYAGFEGRYSDESSSNGGFAGIRVRF